MQSIHRNLRLYPAVCCSNSFEKVPSRHLQLYWHIIWKHVPLCRLKPVFKFLNSSHILHLLLFYIAVSPFPLLSVFYTADMYCGDASSS